jgi:hypothetical protein
VIAELLILNTAFGVIKETVMNGKDLLDAGASLGQFFGAEREVKKKLDSGRLSVEDAFAAKRDLEKAEAFLKEKLNSERVGGYMIWLEFKADYIREQRALELRERKRKAANAKEIKELCIFTAKVVGIILTIIAATVGVTFYLRT